MYQYYEHDRQFLKIDKYGVSDDDDNLDEIIESDVKFSQPLRLITGSKQRLFNLQMKITLQPELFGILGNLSNLVEGTLNLINLIITRSQEEPIDTLVFLDRSARPAQYLFRVLWDELKKTNKIPANQKRPAIRFINIGSVTRHSLTKPSEVEQFMQNTYRASDLHNRRVLVVDERTHSGGSVRRTMRLLNSVFEAQADGVSMFQTYPSWYLYHSHKGVVDSSDSPDSATQLIAVRPEDKTMREKSKTLRVGLKIVAKKAAELVYVDQSDS